MNKSFAFFLAVTALALSLSRAEDAPSLPPLTVPILARLAGYAAWTETIKPRKKPPAPTQTPPPNFVPSRSLQSILVEKGPRNRGAVRVWSDGTKTEAWFINGNLYEEDPETHYISVLSAAARATMPFAAGSDFSKADFPELDWISLENFIGVKSLDGTLCYVFESQAGSPWQSKDAIRKAMIEEANRAKSNQPRTTFLNPATILRPKPLIKTVWVDGKTRLPLAFDDGLQFKTYTFTDPPTGEPQPPERFQTAIQNYQRAVRDAQPKTNY